MFEFRLAERLGRTVGELRRSMSQREFVEWKALDQLEREAVAAAAARGGAQ